jgi:hypothetical protein
MVNVLYFQFLKVVRDCAGFQPTVISPTQHPRLGVKAIESSPEQTLTTWTFPVFRVMS